MKLNLRYNTTLPLSLALVALASTQAQSAIISTTGAASLVVPPFGTSLVEGQTQSNNSVFVFDEQENIDVTTPFGIDVRNISGTVQGTGVGGTVNLSPATIVSGNISSAFFHFDPNQRQVGTPLTLSGSVTFDQEIVGIITETETLDGSDFLGLSDVTYPTGAPENDRRGLGWGLNDGDFGDEFITISADKKTLEFSFTALKAIDQLRVITSANPGDVGVEAVPEPNALFGLLAIGAIGAGSRILSQKKQK
jgi:hypothetical protein